MPVRYCPDSGSTQTRLLSEVRKTVDATPFGRVVVVTASGPLRQQLAGALVADGPLLGVSAISLWQFAREILASCGEREPTASSCFDLEVAANDPLAGSLAAPPSGFGAALRDLFSAGFSRATAKPVLRALEQVSATEWPLGARFLPALNTVFERVGDGREADQKLRRAAALVRERDDALAGARVHIVGFAGATGLGAVFLRALLERGATLWLELPHSPVQAVPALELMPIAQARAHVLAFAQQLGEALPQESAGAPAESKLNFLEAPLLSAEADEIALRIHQLLSMQNGPRPERVAVIMADYDTRAIEVARALSAVGVPFHGQAPHAVRTAADRACAAVATLLVHGPTEHPLLRLGSATLPEILRRTLLSDGSMTAVDFAAWLHDATAVWASDSATRAAEPRVKALADSLEALPPCEHSVRTWRLYSAQTLRTTGVSPSADGSFGTQGHGVQLLSPARARGLCFEHIFLLGAEARHWAQAARPSAVFPLVARAAAAAVGLPHLAQVDPVAESAHLFLQLVRAAPHCTLSWICSDDKGREEPPAPWVAALKAHAGGASMRLSLHVQRRYESALQRFGALPAQAAVQLAGLREDKAMHTALMAAHVLPAEVAQVRARSRDAFDNPSFEHPSPWHGVGLSIQKPEQPLSPSRLESMADCGWKAFLEKGLELKPCGDPVRAQLGLSALDFGLLAHKAIELLVQRHEAELHALLQGTAALSEPTARSVVSAAVDEIAVERTQDGHAPGLWHTAPGFRAGVEARLRHVLGIAVDVLRHAQVTKVIGAEVEREVLVGGLKVKFKADLLVETATARLFIDWKTSAKPPTVGSPKKPHLEHGAALQAAIYSEYKGNGGNSVGCYAAISPDHELKLEKRFVKVSSEEYGATLNEVLGVLQGLMTAKLLPPRVVTPSDNQSAACEYCEFKRCCVIGDTRQRDVLKRLGASHPNESAYAAWWRLAGSSEAESEASNV